MSYNLAKVALWSHAELCTGLICGCLPVAPKFVKTVNDRISSWSRQRSSIWSSSRASKHDQILTSVVGKHGQGVQEFQDQVHCNSGRSKPAVLSMVGQREGMIAKERGNEIWRMVCIESVREVEVDANGDLEMQGSASTTDRTV